MIKLADFDYQLPKELIAQYPLAERDKSRLMVLHRDTGKIEHRDFRDIVSYFTPGDLLVLNDTRVIPARLCGKRKTGGKVDVLLLLSKGKHFAYEALIKPARLAIGEEIFFDGGKLRAKLSAKNEITFYVTDERQIYSRGLMPLPPYIKRQPQAEDGRTYQTVYALNDGAIAAPTAGLHFTEELLAAIKSFGVKLGYVTLHVGRGTFKPVKAEDVNDHKMEAEIFSVPIGAQQLIAAARKEGQRIIAVGTTTVRALETLSTGVKEGAADIFICPGYRFKLTDCLLTNFHLPRTTLLILVSAFAGGKLIKEAYAQAIEQRYRFYSYGDAMLIL